MSGIALVDGQHRIQRLEREMAALRADNEKLRRRLADRTDVERAKGRLMELNGWTEEQAYRWLRDTAQRRNRTMGDLARSILLVAPGLIGERRGESR